MHIESISVATATLLHRLLLKLQSDGVLSAEAIDDLFKDAIGASARVGHAANKDAAQFLEEVWKDLKGNRDRPPV
jgi:hypothetical protein